jgi:hypothetical protein
MSIVGRRILFKSKKLKEEFWGTVLDKVLVVKSGHGCSVTKYLVDAVIKKVDDENMYPEKRELLHVKPKNIKMID